MPGMEQGLMTDTVHLFFQLFSNTNSQLKPLAFDFIWQLLNTFYGPSKVLGIVGKEICMEFISFC